MLANQSYGVLKSLTTLGIWGLILTFVPAVQAETNEEILTKVATLFRSARKVISDHQGLINEPRSGKKITAAYVVEQAKKNYANVTGKPFPNLDSKTLSGKLLQAELEAIEEVINNAQSLINNADMGFKGFLPAVFAKQVADTFKARVGNLAYIKLTAPKEYIRNRSNRPDSWEKKVIKKHFQSGSWKQGDIYTETTNLKGKQAYRLIIPEYYGNSCLKCHGDPKGELDITGGKKEGGKLGDLGGAISTAIFLK